MIKDITTESARTCYDGTVDCCVHHLVLVASVVSFWRWLLIGLFVDPDRFAPLASRIGSVIATIGMRI